MVKQRRCQFRFFSIKVVANIQKLKSVYRFDDVHWFAYKNRFLYPVIKKIRKTFKFPEYSHLSFNCPEGELIGWFNRLPGFRPSTKPTNPAKDGMANGKAFCNPPIPMHGCAVISWRAAKQKWKRGWFR